MSYDRVKKETMDLYLSLPQEEEARKARLDIRDKIIELNYSFFGYVATHTYISNTSITYEDKLQSALLHFCECWWWYQWKGRKDLSFSVYYKPRLGEMMERDLNEVKYSLRRSLCMQAGEQLGKHWSKVRYEDLSKVDMPPDKMNSLKAIFGNIYWADLETSQLFIEAPVERTTVLDTVDNDNYDSLEDMLVQEMILRESKITDEMLIELSDMLCVDYELLRRARPIAEKKLYERLKNDRDLYDE